MSRHFNRSLKNQYSWLPKGFISSIVSIVATGRCSIISAVLSNGEFILLIVNDTGTATKFWEFLFILKYAIEFLNMDSNNDLILVLDNASIHLSTESKSTLIKLNFNVMYLPAYSPMLAPVELFFRLVKNKIRAHLHDQNICFNETKDRLIIFNSIHNWNSQWIKNMWIEFVKHAKQWILRLN